jgi:hypothetical protein
MNQPKRKENSIFLEMSALTTIIRTLDLKRLTKE